MPDYSYYGTLPQWFELLAIVITVIVAVQQLTSWRRENIGKRKAELAEDVLAAFYEVQDIMRHVRSVGGFASEADGRQRHESETPEQTRTLDDYYARANRLHGHNEFFAQLRAKEYRFQAIFGNEAKAPFDLVFKAKHKFELAVRLLMGDAHPRGFTRLNDENRRKYEELLYNEKDDDEIETDIAKAIEQIEQVCRPALLEYDTMKRSSGPL